MKSNPLAGAFCLGTILFCVVSLSSQALLAADLKTVDLKTVSGSYKAKADDMMVEGRYSDAADLYGRALEETPNNIYALAGLGMALGRQGKLEEAERYFDRTLQLDPKNAVAHCGKAMVILNRIQAVPESNKKERLALLRQAGKECNAAIDADPRVVEAHYLLGRVYKDEGRLDRAAQAFNGAIKLDPKYVNAYIALGGVQILSEQLNEAIDTYNRALQLNPKSASSHFGLGQIYFKQGKTEESIKELNASLAQNPDNAACHGVLAQAYEMLCDLPSAVKEYEQAIRVKPKIASYYLDSARLYNLRGDVDMAIALLRQGLQAIPNDPNLRLSIACAYARTDRFDLAMIEYEAILSMFPNDAEAANDLARALYLRALRRDGNFISSQDFDHSARLIAQAVKLNPNNVILKLAQARLQFLVTGQVSDLSGLVPKNNAERVALAETLLAQGKFSEASELMRTAIINASTRKDIFSLADIALMNKDLDNAELAYKKAASFTGGAERARFSLELLTKAKESANQNVRMAMRFLRSRNIAAATEHYREAVFLNPRLADARSGLAEALERLNPTPQSEALRAVREAIFNYQACLTLLPPTSYEAQERVSKRLTSLQQKEAKLLRSANATKQSGLDRFLQIPKLHIALPKLNEKH